MDPQVPEPCIFILTNTTVNYSLLWIILILILCSAFFSMVETALTCCNRVRLKVKAEDGSASSKLVLRILNKYEQSLISILIGNNVVNIGASSIATILAMHVIRDDAIATLVSTIVMTIIIFMFGEIIPKNIGKANADKAAQILCYPLAVIYILTYPLMQVFNFILWCFKMIFKIKDDETTLTEDEFQDIVESVEEEGVLDEEESDIIQAAVEFNDITVKTVMTPKEKMVTLNFKELSKESLLKSIDDIRYTRIPVYTGNPDNIIGIFNIRKFVKVAFESKRFGVKQSLSEVIFVNENEELDNLVELFKTKKCHMAIVKNDEGLVTGLVTMEDALEELVGETKNKGGKR